MTELNELTINHEDGLQTFKFQKGGYCIKKDRISISIETDNKDPQAHPSRALLCIANAPIEGKLAVGSVFEFNNEDVEFDDDGNAVTDAYGYFDFHAEQVYVKWTVLEIRGDVIVFSLEARHDDIDNYDESAKECPTKGTFALPKTRMDALWNPD